jgi:hypothetical protein
VEGGHGVLKRTAGHKTWWYGMSVGLSVRLCLSMPALCRMCISGCTYNAYVLMTLSVYCSFGNLQECTLGLINYKHQTLNVFTGV